MPSLSVRTRTAFRFALFPAVLLMVLNGLTGEPFGGRSGHDPGLGDRAAALDARYGPPLGTLAVQPTCDGSTLPADDVATAAPGQITRIQHDASGLVVGRAAVLSLTQIRAESVCAEEIAPLDQGMTNVTRGPRRGYRFLPHMTFQDDLDISVPYDATLIPPGLSEQDVRTFFYDTDAGRWQALDRVSVDPSTSAVISHTNHFTDFINATITVPDHPGTLSYDPTSIKDIKGADPGTGINLIDPPQAGSTGGAHLSYPIDIPQGRHGQAPKLSLSYDSAGGDGWLGVGWDLAAPAVSVDTHWGVPRYDAATETETYTLNGEQLTPVAHRGPAVARTGEKVFHNRIETAFRVIVRHGSGPTDYWWEVTEKDGTRAFYGGDPESGSVAATQLTDGAGHIFRWALRETRDLVGNRVRYTYATVTDVGVAGGTVPGVNLYPRTINYTGTASAAGAYTVTFVRDSELPGYQRRPDVVISARGGFKQVTAELLKRVEVSFNGQSVRSYELGYTEGAFRKTLLQSISQRGAQGTLFHTHTFSYYDDIRDTAGGYNGFAGTTNWSTGSDDVTAGLLGQGHASALSGNISTGVGGHLYVGFNPTSPTKQFSGGAKVGFTHSSNDGVLALIDLNGDNLPDKVFRRDSGIVFRLNTSGPDGSADFSSAVRPAPGLPAISHESANMYSFGAEAYFVANVFTNHSETFTTSDTYFTDVNGDGLPDLVNSGQVLFNHLDPAGVPTFTADSADTPLPIGGGTVDTTGIVDNFEALRQQQIDNFPLVDSLRRWVAPFDGRVRVTGTVALIEDHSPARAQSRTADGIRAAIQQNGAELWSTVIAGDDYAPQTPSNVDSLVVNRGDRLYFRVQSSFDGAFDQVAWDPQIEYLNVTPVTDVNNLPAYRYRASDDFTLAGRRGVLVQAPLDGTVHLTGNLHKRGVTTDDITLLVLRNGVSVFSSSLAWDAVGDIPVDLDIAVSRQDTIALRVKVDSPIDASRIEWTPELFYTSSPSANVVDSNGNPIVQLHPPYDVDLYPEDGLLAPQPAWVAPASGTFTVTPQLSVSPGTGGTVTFTAKRRGALVAKRAIAISNGSVGDASFDVTVDQGDELFFDFSVYDPQLRDRITGHGVEVTDSNGTATAAPNALHSASFPGLLPQAYRGWTYAGYNGNRDRAFQPVVEADLNKSFDQNSTYDPRTASAYLYSPSPEDSSWRGPDDLTYIRAGTASSSRLGPDTITVPRPGDFAGARAVDRLGHTSETAIGAGISFLSGSVSDGSSNGEVDYLDLNGDHFPDVVSNGRVQYTTTTGGLESNSRPVPGLGDPRNTDATAVNVGVGGSPASFTANARGQVDNAGHAPSGNGTGSQMVSLGLSGSLGRGDSTPQSDLLDVNGDGLPDRVTRGGQLMVALNLGYGFAAPEPWGTAALNPGASESGSIGASLGFNGGIYDFAGGVSLNKNKSETGEMLSDVNGDGLVDRILPNGGGLRVALNTGTGFDAPRPWAGALSGICRDNTSVGLAGIDWDSVRVCSGTTGLGAGAYFTIGIGPLCWPTPLCYIILNPGADANQTMSREEAVLRDVDGDGYADHLASTGDGQLAVALNRTGRTNLLRTVSRPLGASISLEYQRDGNTTDQPDSRWVLSRTSVYDGHAGDGVDNQVTTYEYAGGKYDRGEREFYGYATVTEHHLDPVNVYRTTVHEYRNDSYYTHGLPGRTRTFDAAGHVFSDTQLTYVLRDVTTGAEPADPASTTATVFPQLVRTEERFNEGGASAVKSTVTTQHYDALGNVDVTVDAGDAGTADDVRATVDYSACTATHVVAPTAITVTGGGSLMRHREASIDCATGNVSQIRQYLADGSAAVTDLEYFPNGLLRKVTSPPNATLQRAQVSYEYDPTVSTYITRVTDTFGLTSTSTHDLRFGATTAETDVNGNTTSYTVDEFGRTATVTGPYEQGTGVVTIRFGYHPEAVVPWALTQHADTFRSPTDTIDTVVFIDGLKRVIQTKKDSTVFTGVGSAAADRMTVSGQLRFDFLGRTVAMFYPTVEPLGSAGTFNAAADTSPPTRLSYDVLDRNTSTTLPDNTVTSTAYGFGADRSGVTQFEAAVTDANGHVKRTFRNVRELMTSLQEVHSGQPIWTSYRYDALNQLVSITDDAGHTTATSFDNLGRRTAVDSPDSGRTETVYDLAANPIARITANLRAENRRINLAYDVNRLVAITYPDFPGNNVSYVYGAPGATGNGAGRVVQVTDQSGVELRSYGRLGEVTQEVRTVATPTGPQPTYTSRYTYDTFGRLQSMVYPDGEVLTYSYDSGGQVRAANGVKGTNSYAYLNRLEYDRFDQRVFQEDGNGVRTQYAFDPLNRRLAGIQTGPAGGNLFQNTSYSYDSVGNVLGLVNDVAVPPPNLKGGPTSQTFNYDDLDRLTGAAGTYAFAPDKSNRYSLALTYDSLHNVRTKTQTNDIVEPSSTPLPQHDTTYTYSYAYGAAQPHAPSHIGTRTFSYDANGNQAGWTDDGNGQRRGILWDEENRIQSVSDDGHTMSYQYDDAGQRVVKRGPQGETVYVNQYFTVRNGQIGTKHVFVGTTRIASKLVAQNKPNSNPNGAQPFEKDQFYFHSDQVSSTNYVTDANGKIFEHLEYFPSGETWVQEASNTQRTPYQFSGKELDEETSLYYFGARYYDPKTGVWQSPDPALERRLQELPEDAGKSASSVDVAQPSFLNLYSYADANPVAKVDPDGRQVPLTTVQLRAIARSQGIGAGLSGVQFNRAVGRAFQEFALNSFGLIENFTPFPSPARAAATGGLPAAVIPDAVRAVTKVELRWYFWPTVTQYPNSSFFEVKAVAGVLNLSYSNHQIRGLIDVAARSPAGLATGPHRPLPIITFITTGDTIIGPDVLAEATRRGVAIWQSIAYTVPTSSGGTQIAFGPVIPLNPGVYSGAAAVPVPGAPPGTIGPAHSGGPPGDPDPAEVQ